MVDNPEPLVIIAKTKVNPQEIHVVDLQQHNPPTKLVYFEGNLHLIYVSYRAHFPRDMVSYINHLETARTQKKGTSNIISTAHNAHHKKKT